MSEMKVESQVEPDAAATSISNDQTASEAVKPESTTEVSAAPTVSEDTVMAEEKTAADNDKKADDSEEKKAPTPQGRGDYPNKRRRQTYNKSDFSELPESSDAHEIRRQVEFYFSDSNLPTDKYLLEQSGGHRNLPVDLKVIHSFKRMHHFQPYSAVYDAVKASSTLDITEDGAITRKVPLSDKFTDDVDANRKIHQDKTMARSVYAKGFGEETKTSQTDIEDFFAIYGTVNAVRLRRRSDGFFKGSVFVEFTTEQQAFDFLRMEPKPKFKAADGQEKTLIFKSKKEYVDEKVEDIKEGRVAPNSPRKSGESWKDRRSRDQDRDGHRGGRGGGRGGRGRGRGGNRGGSRGGRGGGGRDRDRDDRRGPSDRNEERANKRSAPDSGEQGEAKKAKTAEGTNE